MSAGFAQIQRFVRETAGLAIEDEKRYFVEDRLKPVLRAAALRTLDDLALDLQADRHSELARTVVETLTIHETSFFRDRPLFAALSERLLPRLLEARESVRRLRIWCAGCSTGQEPYSIAMHMEDVMRKRPGWRVEILATDLSRQIVDQARLGVYSQFEVQRGLPVALLLRHFARSGDAWQISPHLRAKVTFRAENLMATPSIEPFDLILCRNVLFYFDPDTKRRVLCRLSNLLADDGRLILGGGERPGDLCPVLHADPAAPFTFEREKADARATAAV